MEKAIPIPGVDYPRTFQEMDGWFRTEAGCRDYIRRLRWPDGFVCRRCGAAEESWVTARGVLIPIRIKNSVNCGSGSLAAKPKYIAAKAAPTSGRIIVVFNENWSYV